MKHFVRHLNIFSLVETDEGRSGEKLTSKWGTVAQLKKILLVGFVVFCAEYATATPVN